MTSKRESSFKSHLTKEYLITNRIEKNLSLRKIQVAKFIDSKRFRTFHKENEMDVEINSEITSKLFSSSSFYLLWKTLQNLDCNDNNLDQYVYYLKSDDPATKLKALVSIRKLLSKPDDPPIKEIISKEILVILFNIVKSAQDDRILFEIIWIFVNVASSDYAHYLNDHGIMDVLSDMISTNHPNDLIDELIWLIGNLAAHDSNYKKEIRARNFHEYLFKVFIQNNSATINKSCLWALSSVIEGAKEINLSENLCTSVSICCETIGSYIRHKKNNALKVDRIESLIAYAISIICSVTECKPCTLTILIKHTSAAHFIELLDTKKIEEGTYLNVLRVLGNFSANEHLFTDELIKYDILPKFKEILERNPKSNITKEICWILSNIAAGLQQHVDMFFKTKNIVALLFKILRKENSDVTKEVLWCICNLTTTGNSTYLNCLVNYGIIEIFSEWLGHTDYRLSALVMEALENMMSNLMHHDITRKLLYVQCDSFGILHKLQALFLNSNRLLSTKSEEIMNKYFLYFKEEEDLEMFDRDELLICSGNDITDESQDIMPFITGVKNKENDPHYANSNSLNDSTYLEYSLFI